jgi:hypothetical protein
MRVCAFQIISLCPRPSVSSQCCELWRDLVPVTILRHIAKALDSTMGMLACPAGRLWCIMHVCMWGTPCAGTCPSGALRCLAW